MFVHPRTRTDPMQHRCYCRTGFFCLFVHPRTRTDPNVANASLSRTTCRTHRPHIHSASIITTLGGWIGAAEVYKVHSAGTGTSHKVSSLQIHDRTQTRQTQLHAATPWLGLKLKRTSLCALRGLLWELNPGPLAPEARIIPLDQAAD